MKYIAITYFIASFMGISGYWIYSTMIGVPKEITLGKLKTFLNIFWWPIGSVCLLSLFLTLIGFDLLGTVGYGFKLGIAAIVSIFVIIRAAIHTNGNMVIWLPVYSTLEFIFLNVMVLTGVDFKTYVETVDVNESAVVQMVKQGVNVADNAPSPSQPRKATKTTHSTAGSPVTIIPDIAFIFFQPNDDSKIKRGNGKQSYVTKGQYATFYEKSGTFSKIKFGKRSFWIKTVNLQF